MGKKTAYIELNATNQIRSLSSGTGSKSFSYLGFDLFPCTTLTSLPEILRMDYEYFILDMGVLNHYTAGEFFKCEKQFLVCSFSKWKKAQTMEKLERLLTNNHYTQAECLIILSINSKKESTLTMSHSLTFRMKPIPFIPNPFQLPSEFFAFFGKLLG